MLTDTHYLQQKRGFFISFLCAEDSEVYVRPSVSHSQSRSMCIVLNSCKVGGQPWKPDWAWYFELNPSKCKRCHCVPGVDGGPGSPLSLQHTLLLSGARQRGGGGAGGRRFTRTPQSFTPGGAIIEISGHARETWRCSVFAHLLSLLSNTRRQRPARGNWKRRLQLSCPSWKMTDWQKVKSFSHYQTHGYHTRAFALFLYKSSLVSA